MTACGMFKSPGPRWFSIPAHRPFVSDLAQGLYDALAPMGPDALSQAIILTPTRRGARNLADAFVAAAQGRAVLPPQIRPLGDLDEGEAPFEPGDLALDLPPSITPVRRRFELIRLVKAHEGALGRNLDPGAALELADALGGFLDSLQIEEVSAEAGLSDLVHAELAEHWQVSREFLEMALEAWPRRLEDLGVADVSARRVALLRALAAKWDQTPPPGVLIAAGSTGTAPATAALLAVIARAPQGAVVLPGLDKDLATSAWAKVDEQHPQGAMKRLLDGAGVTREQVRRWPASRAYSSRGRWRRRLINEALRPASETSDWLKVLQHFTEEGRGEAIDPVAEGLSGLSLVSAAHEEEAATVAALLLREVLETPGRTAALVSPDQVLARRVATRLARWGVVADSSAGVDLAGCPCGVLADLVAQAVADPLHPVRLLAILKHPLVRLGLPPEDMALARRDLELKALRGPRRFDWETLDRLLAAHPAARDLLARYRAALQPAVEASGGAPSAAARGLTQTLETLASDSDGSTGGLWAGASGECLARLLSGIIEESDGLFDASPRGFADLLRRLIADETVRSGGATHPRIRILGAIEARLSRADRLIVAGLEEGVWPQGIGADPFLSRPMRKTLGLPPPERRVGLAAHDFAQAACAPETILLHTERRGGSPTVKSRWLWRLETLVRGAGLTLPQRPEVLDWARGLDAPGPYAPVPRPAPRPPQAHRPRKMAVTRIETLTRDPYAVWARDILRFYPLDRPDEPVDARARGTAIHRAFEQFVLAHPRTLPPDSAAIFEELYVQALVDQGMPQEALARERALAREAAEWVADLEARRRADGRVIHVERSGALDVDLAGGRFTVTAKADRIEVDPAGRGHILDYKTGKAPSKNMVKAGFSPQLTLTAAILAAGGFADIGKSEPAELTYLEVTGRRPAGKEVTPVAEEDTVQAASDALEGMKALIDRFDDPDQPYMSRTAPQFVKARVSDYDHLARVFEWSTAGEEGEE